ncbi:ATP-binding protein [Salipaludibacillus sp. CUR1]|uniref:sensor histidine kinase n=1 Tax=Salipaludibacillus sp. CUR1 TaxID=2820003 RepID=UPI001E6506B4|nr:ATP-binding protein [Salipaludibacillus sp. CUR1]MCE7793969.1 ATP-binding protein [Salipaludibacillus sp. CUR1]
MFRQLTSQIKRSLAKKITTWVMISLIVLIVFIISGAHWITANFYQEHLTHEVEGRLAAHAALLETEQSSEILDYINILETGKHSVLLIVNEEGEPVFTSDNISGEKINDYIQFIEENRSELLTHHQITYTDEVDTMAFHIPHVWGTAAIYNQNGETAGYVFIDQDTGELNVARINLLKLLALMGALTLLVGYLFIRYLTRRISNPLNEMSQRTHDIADGDFDIKLNVKGEDEVGTLGKNIQQMTKQLKEYRDSRREFISHVSHDLRTPITYIKGYSALMKDAENVDKEGWKRHLGVIYDEAIRMESLVSDLFLLTKLQEGKIQIHYEEVNVSEWLSSLFKSRAIMFDQKQIEGTLDIDPSLEKRALSLDAFRMEQALINILENAIRFTDVNGSIRLSCYKENEKVVFEIADTGEGMDEQELDRIWERFYKADPSRSRDDSGTGLGLAIVKEIVEAHNGSVKVESKKGRGTTFYLYIPFAN